MPELDAVAAEMAGKPVQFLAVSLETDARRVRVAVETLKLRLPVGTAESEMLGPLGLDTVPATIFVDASGRVVARVRTASKDTLKAQAEQLLASSTADSATPRRRAAQ